MGWTPATFPMRRSHTGSSSHNTSTLPENNGDLTMHIAVGTCNNDLTIPDEPPLSRTTMDP